MRFGQAPHQRQAQSGAACLTVKRLSTWLKGLKILSSLSGGMPGPLSRTIDLETAIRGAARHHIDASAVRGGLTALETRLIRIA